MTSLTLRYSMTTRFTLLGCFIQMMQPWTLSTEAANDPPVKGLNEFLQRRSAFPEGSYCGAEPVDGVLLQRNFFSRRSDKRAAA